MTLVCALAVNTETSDEALVSSVHLPELELSAFFFKTRYYHTTLRPSMRIFKTGSDSDKYDRDFLVKLNVKL